MDATTEETAGKKGSKVGLRRTEIVREGRERIGQGHRAIHRLLLVQAKKCADPGPAGRGLKARRSVSEERSGDVRIPIGREDGAESITEKAGWAGGCCQGPPKGEGESKTGAESRERSSCEEKASVKRRRQRVEGRSGDESRGHQTGRARERSSSGFDGCKLLQDEVQCGREGEIHRGSGSRSLRVPQPHGHYKRGNAEGQHGKALRSLQGAPMCSRLWGRRDGRLHHPRRKGKGDTGYHSGRGLDSESGVGEAASSCRRTGSATRTGAEGDSLGTEGEGKGELKQFIGQDQEEKEEGKEEKGKEEEEKGREEQAAVRRYIQGTEGEEARWHFRNGRFHKGVGGFVRRDRFGPKGSHKEKGGEEGSFLSQPEKQGKGQHYQQLEFFKQFGERRRGPRGDESFQRDRETKGPLRTFPRGSHSGVIGGYAGGSSPGDGGGSGNIRSKAHGIDVCSTAVEQEGNWPCSSRSSKSMHRTGPHHQGEPSESGGRDFPKVEITGINSQRLSLVGGAKVGMHGSGQPKYFQQKRDQVGPEGDVRGCEDEAVSGSPWAQERRESERERTQRKDKGRQRRWKGKRSRRAEREERWERRRTQRKPLEEVRRLSQDEAAGEEVASSSLEASGGSGIQFKDEAIKPGVASPCKLVESFSSGDWPFKAVPSGGSGTEEFFQSHALDGTTLGATDPRSSLVDVPGSPRVSGEKVQRSDEVGHFCLGNLGPRVLQGFLEVLPLRSKTMEVRNGGSLFPLPSSRERLKNLFPELEEMGLSWLVALCVSLNSLWGGQDFCDAEITPCQKGCLAELLKDVNRVISLKSTIPGFSWKEFFQTRSVDYQGEEVKIAKRFGWDNICHALPAEIGRVPLREVCSYGARHFVDNIDLYIKPKEHWGKIAPPKVMVSDADWEAVCKGLMDCGLCCALPQEEIFDTGEGPLLNGMFGVSKEEVIEGTEVYRLIMNLIPFNSISEPLSGDVGTLPTWSSMTSLFLQPHEKLLISSEDVRCFFYTMSVPSDWVKYLAFNKQIPDTALPEELKGRECYLASLVLPMGYLNSVSLAQHVHRNLALASGRDLSSGSQVNTPDSELRKDLPFPDCDPRWHIYLDNYDLLERVEATQVLSLEGTEAPGVAALKAEYVKWEVPRNQKKSTARSTHAEVQGAQVDGSLGVAYPKESKLLKYVMAALQLCDQGRSTQRQLQVVCGGLVYISMFRRPLLGCLNTVWQFISSFEDNPGRSKVLPIQCKLEILRFLCLIPLARMDFRLEIDPRVSCSDASEHGGGLCSSTGLSGLGQLASSGALRGHPGVVRDSDPVLCVGIFDGIGALGLHWISLDVG